MTKSKIDLEKFRLRRFVDRLIELGEVEVHEEPVPMIGLSTIIEATPRATLFKNAGPEHFELVAAVSGSRRRVAAAFGSDERGVVHEYMRRMASPQPVVEISSAEAPVHQVIRTGEEIDLTRLPFFLQHELDGGCYISSGIDYSVDPVTGKTNVGCRRMMLRDRNTFRSNLTAPSDLRKMYHACIERGDFFVPEMLISGKAMSGALNILRPLLAQTGAETVGTFLMGTVKGDVHDIGKNLVNIMLEGAGFEVIDIGVQVAPEKFVAAINEHKPDIVGMSAFLTTTMPMFKVNIHEINKAGLRDQVIIMVGGAPVTQEYADVVGADGYAADASSAVKVAKELLAKKRAS